MPLLLNPPTKSIDLNNNITLLSSRHLIGRFHFYQLIFDILYLFSLEHKQFSDTLWYVFSKLIQDDKNTCWHQLELCYVLHHSKLALGLHSIVKKVELKNKHGRHTWHRIKKNVLLKSSSVTCFSSLIIFIINIYKKKPHKWFLSSNV